MGTNMIMPSGVMMLSTSLRKPHTSRMKILSSTLCMEPTRSEYRKDPEGDTQNSLHVYRSRSRFIPAEHRWCLAALLSVMLFVLSVSAMDDAAPSQRVLED